MLLSLGARQAAALGLLGLILSVIGVYGVVSYGAAQRTREIGIRMALGAEPNHVLSLVMGQGITIVGGGVLVGLITTLALAPVLRRVLLVGSAADPLAIAGVTVMLTVIALTACYIPARRAMRADPVTALRHE